MWHSESCHRTRKWTLFLKCKEANLHHFSADFSWVTILLKATHEVPCFIFGFLPFAVQSVNFLQFIGCLQLVSFCVEGMYCTHFLDRPQHFRIYTRTLQKKPSIKRMNLGCRTPPWDLLDQIVKRLHMMLCWINFISWSDLQINSSFPPRANSSWVRRFFKNQSYVKVF